MNNALKTAQVNLKNIRFFLEEAARTPRLACPKAVKRAQVEEVKLLQRVAELSQ